MIALAWGSTLLAQNECPNPEGGDCGFGLGGEQLGLGLGGEPRLPECQRRRTGLPRGRLT